MGVLNFAHASFYMLGAYFGFEISRRLGFWPAIFGAPLLTGICGALVERYGLRRVHRYGHVPELLFTFGVAAVIEELVSMFWGKLPVDYHAPPSLNFTAFTLFGTSYPAYRLFVLIFMVVFGVGSGLAGLAGAIAGPALVTEPSMAATLGPILFVVIIFGGMGSLAGAFVASLVLGLVQTFAVAINVSPATLLSAAAAPYFGDLWTVTVAQVAPLIPYLLLVVVLIFRPTGLMGTRI
jgi:branched-chain amino acid transport system permease protein